MTTPPVQFRKVGTSAWATDDMRFQIWRPSCGGWTVASYFGEGVQWLERLTGSSYPSFSTLREAKQTLSALLMAEPAPELPIRIPPARRISNTVWMIRDWGLRIVHLDGEWQLRSAISGQWLAPEMTEPCRTKAEAVNLATASVFNGDWAPATA